jgi:7-carboxy-7-deazaguanine synthase
MRRLYSVKEAFYTLQGEGAHAGLPAVFVRFAGCNLWSGREEDRGRGAGSCSAWCDTDFVGVNGAHGGKYTAAAIAELVLKLWPQGSVRPRVVLTGGEPLLQVDAALVEELLAAGCWIAVETNGTQPVPPGIDWVCVSPKAGASLVLREADELKVVFPQEVEPDTYLIASQRMAIQPRAGVANAVALALEYVRANPQWRLSLQLHKLLGVP